MRPEISLQVISQHSAGKVWSIPLGGLETPYRSKVWDFEPISGDSGNPALGLRVGVEGYYDPTLGWYRPEGGRDAHERAIKLGHRLDLTCLVLVHADCLPEASRVKRIQDPKSWKVWIEGVIEVRVDFIKIDPEKGYLTARMCRLNGSLKGTGISGISSLILPWEEEEGGVI